MKPELLWEVEHGLPLTGPDLTTAARERTVFHTRMVELLTAFDAVVLPTAQVWPFAVEQHWPTHIAGREMDTYHRWMEATIYATLAGLPAVNVPVGFSDGTAPGVPAGLPMGMQVIGRPRADTEVLGIAHAYESTIGHLGVGGA
jgi:amidase